MWFYHRKQPPALGRNSLQICFRWGVSIRLGCGGGNINSAQRNEEIRGTIQLVELFVGKIVAETISPFLLPRKKHPWFTINLFNGSLRNACSRTSPPSTTRGWSASSRFRHRAARCGHQQHAERGSARKAAHTDFACLCPGCAKVWGWRARTHTRTHTRTARSQRLWGHLTSIVT